jgi:hypothetical protein
MKTRADQPRRTALGIAMMLVSLAVAVLAQYQVNRQVGGAVQPIYGGSGSAGGGSVRYGYVTPSVPGSSTLLPSEARNAYYRSGALPSEVRMNYRAVGPMAPGGAAAYLPSQSPVVIRTGAAPTGNMVNPAAPRNAAVGSQSPGGVSSLSAAAAVPSIRYSNFAPPPAVAPAAASSSASLSAVPTWTGSVANVPTQMLGSVHYSP